MAKKYDTIDFSDFSGGLNNTEPPIKLFKNQVQDCLNAILRSNGGFERRPGTEGLSASQTFTTFIRGLHRYKQLDATEKLLALSNGKLFDVNTSSEALTERFDLGGAGGEAFFEDYRDKAWVANGTEVVKLEDETAFQVGITPPSGGASALVAGGSLPTGVYQCKVSYYRKVSGTIELYSVGEDLGNITTAGGDLSIRITAPDSSDLQVNGAVAWLTDAGGATFFSFGTVDGSGSYTIDITDTTNRNAALVYSVQALNNFRPPGFTSIIFAGHRLFGADPTDKNRIRYSLKDASVFDLERFPDANRVDYPFEVTGFFVLGEHLYVNTVGGVFRQPFADPTAERELVGLGELHFVYIKTVAEWGSRVVGLTNKGIRIFDGINFSSFDLSKAYKKEIDKIYNANADHQPSAIVYQRNIRTEYQLVYQDTTVAQTTSVNNRRLIINLDSIRLFESNQVSAPAELWSTGANYMAVFDDATIFSAQSISGDSHIYKEDSTDTQDINVYSESGAFLTTASDVAMRVFTRQVLSNLRFRQKYRKVRALIQQDKSTLVTVVSGDVDNLNDAVNLGAGAGQPNWDEVDWDDFFWGSEGLNPNIQPLKDNLRGYSCFVKFEQQANDPDYQMMNCLVETLGIANRFT